MDSKDFRLLVALDQDARQSLSTLGRRVSLSAPAVRERIRRLERQSIVQGYWVSIDPAIFDRKEVLVYFREERDRDEAARVLNADDVAWVAWKVDGGITVQLWPRGVEGAVARLSRFVGNEPTWHGVSNSRWNGAPSMLDWRVLDALVDAPRAAVEHLAHTTGLSPKTVRRHIGRLTTSEAIFVVPRLGSLTDAGELVYHLLVSGTVSLADVRRTIGDAASSTRPQCPGGSTCSAGRTA